MSRILPIILCCALLCFASAYELIEGGRGEGESCEQDGEVGQCTRITRCPAVYSEKQNSWWKIKICGFVGTQFNTESVICCVPTRTTTTSATTTTPKPVATTPPMGNVTTEYMPPTEIYYKSFVDSRLGPDGCMPMRKDITTDRRPEEEKSWNKCLDYQTKLIYPCEESAALMTGDKVRGDHCNHNADELIAGGVDAKTNEFPHMVLLGYGESNGSAVWQCGGTLISERFILTAAHCTRAKDLGYVNYAIVGSLKRTDNVNASQVYRIKRIIKHPNYNSRTKHNDIALLKTADPIHLDLSTVPACLDVFGGDHDKVVATGWGAMTYMGKIANTLQKVTLTKFTDEECSYHYPTNRYGGTFNSTTQVCYGDYTKISDTCQGDSGGPLTTLNPRIHCMYTVVGITSFGKICGYPGKPGWYTRVAHYVPWIESIVWP